MPNKQRMLLGLLGTLFGMFVTAPAIALGDGASMRVTINLNAPQHQRCISQSMSQQANAEVRVVCQTGQFVEIEPAPGKPFTGTHGDAFRYHLPFSANLGGTLVASTGAYLGAGTITALRIYNVNGADGPLEMLVSF